MTGARGKVPSWQRLLKHEVDSSGLAAGQLGRGFQADGVTTQAGVLNGRLPQQGVRVS